MCVKDVVINNQVGLHARPATFFIQKANEFKSSVWVEKEDRRVNAKSLLGVLSLGITGGTNIMIIADGQDVITHCGKLFGVASSYARTASCDECEGVCSFHNFVS